jgi:erythromycin esterase
MRTGKKDPLIVSTAAERARPFAKLEDLSPLIDHVKDARVVMLGEASHGTEEFYAWRRLISAELIKKHGFRFIVVEGDWPPAWNLNAYVHGLGSARTAREAVSGFHRWPTWMWANHEIVELASWLREHNERLPDEEKAGFYGLDVYSLFESVGAILKQLEPYPFLARKARLRYECFGRFHEDETAYARSLLQFPEGCEKQALLSLQELLAARLDEPAAALAPFQDRLFSAEQNARTVANAERYYRAMMHGTEDSWNVRDQHMQETLEALLQRYGQDAKAIVWAHNTHIGDYRATSMKEEGQVNIGGLARQAFGEDQVKLVGFGTYRGEVTAAAAWDGAVETMRVPEARPDSYEAVLHEAAAYLKAPNLFLTFPKHREKNDPLDTVLGHRAIGVVYRPSYERLGNYVPTSLGRRYDAFLFLDETSALRPLDQQFNRGEIPETWPQGF